MEMDTPPARAWGSRSLSPGVLRCRAGSVTLWASPLRELPSHLTGQGVGSDEWFSNIFNQRIFLRKSCYTRAGAALSKQGGGLEPGGAERGACRGGGKAPGLMNPRWVSRIIGTGTFLRKICLVVLINRAFWKWYYQKIENHGPWF